MSLVIAGALIAGFAPGCKKGGENLEISISDFSDLYKKNSGVNILDVREPAEYNDGHVPGAKLVSLGTLSAGTAQVPFNKEDTIYVICRSGNRSMTATKILRSTGYPNAVSVGGGTLAWIANGNPVEKPVPANP